MIGDEEINYLWKKIYEFDDKYDIRFERGDIFAYETAMAIIAGIDLYNKIDYGMFTQKDKNEVDIIEHYLHTIRADSLINKVDNKFDLSKIIAVILKYYVSRNRDDWDLSNEKVKEFIDYIKQEQDFYESVM